MKKVNIAYGMTGMSALLPEKNLLGVFESQLPPAVADEAAEIRRALDEPIDSLPLEELARGRKSCVIIASDHTRPVPSKFIIPEMLRRLRLGNGQIDITILIATGCHRQTTLKELTAKFGEDIVKNEKIVIHDADDEQNMISCGTLPSGGALRLNRLACETELLISEGFIEPHFFAGFSGGRKSVLPGIAARETVMANHCAEFINDPAARTGSLDGNPIHKDMLFAAVKAKLAFIVNVVINGEKKIVKAFAGNMESAHRKGCEFLRSQCQIPVPPADIVITSNGGYPLDQNVYQAVKGMTAGEAVCRPGGVIILCAGCSDGHGGEAFYRTLKEMVSPATLLDEISRVPRNRTTPDQWQYQILARIMSRYKIIIVTADGDHQLIREMKFEAASSVESALEMAFPIVGEDAGIAVIPDGVAVIVSKAG
ncbi:MAG: nickel-dependent lactate racemase [Lentisphaeria bacterium]|nr:nickel-dependent lactate racemase [Lentisphaeria bacterium]